MSDPSAPSPDVNHADDIAEQTSSRWLLRAFIGLVAFAVLWWMYFDQAALSMKSWWGRRYIPQVMQSLDAEEWSTAAHNLNDATRWAPDDTEVLRTAVEFVKRTGSEPRTMIRFLSRLDELKQATPAEMALMGRMYVQLPDLKKAHEIYDGIPPDQLYTRPTLELLAAIQQAEGLHARSFLTRRQALLAAPDDPDSILQLALLDARSGDASLVGPARERLWPIARGGGIHALPAIEFLAQHRQLTSGEAAELLTIVDAIKDNPKTEATRFQVLSAGLRLNPHRRQELLNQEIIRWKGKPAASLPPLLQWLVSQNENERVLRMVSDKTASVYASLLPHYVAALRGEKKWGAIKVLMGSKIDPSFPRAQMRIWLAEAESHLSSDPTTPRHILNTVLDESGRGENLDMARVAAEMAEQLGYWDIAGRCYDGIATRHPEIALNMQIKVYDMASRELDGATMLRASERLRDLKATDVVFLDRVNYLRLVLGTDIELAHQTLDETAAQPQHHITADRQIALSLLRAIAAYREGRGDLIAGHLAGVKQVDSFPPGPRAVYAGLLAISGDTTSAYRVAEKVPPVLLLPEERRFLAKAR